MRMINKSLLFGGYEFLSQSCADSRHSTNICAVRGKLENAIICNSDLVAKKVHQVIRSLQKSSWSVQSIILMVVIIVLKSL